MDGRGTGRALIRIPPPTVWCGRSNRILAYRTPLRVLPVVEEFLRDMAPYEPSERARLLPEHRKAMEDKKFQEEVERDESLNFLLRDTISLTMLGGSSRPT